MWSTLSPLVSVKLLNATTKVGSAQATGAHRVEGRKFVPYRVPSENASTSILVRWISWHLIP
jgi:hypothetical protein